MMQISIYEWQRSEIIKLTSPGYDPGPYLGNDLEDDLGDDLVEGKLTQFEEYFVGYSLRFFNQTKILF